MEDGHQIQHDVPQREEDTRSAKKAKSNGADGAANGANAYDWQALHNDLEAGREIGVYGGPNAVYFGLAGLRAKVNMDDFHTKRSKDETYNPDLHALIQNPHTRRRWGDIVTLDPLGMYARRPTMAACTANMEIPELKFEPDGKVVNADGSFKVIKCAIDYVWNIPGLSERLNFPEDAVRDALYKYTRIEAVKDRSKNAFLPPTGGATIYIWGDPKKLADKNTEVAVRVHDQCTGSDVFGTDICTCRPYLIFAIKGCVECAQRGGVGLVIYYQKEGRSLGEVTKFRVYNARKAQVGGDRPEMYFYQTETIAGIRDARFQEMMPDVLLWLGITRIDWLLSMSSDKYDAIVGAGIKVMQRVSLPDKYVPAGAQVEITAKISAGYHAEAGATENVVESLRRLEAVRERCTQVMELAKSGHSNHFNLHLEKLPATVDFVMKVMKANYPDTSQIPYHSRFRHFPAGQVEKLTSKWFCDATEKARRLIDLSTVSVLLDAGSGNTWQYVDNDGVVYRRSEGIAVATLHMFEDGLFSSDVAMKHRVNEHGLKNMKVEDFTHGFQVSSGNVMAGVDGRFKLMKRLAAALHSHPEYFGREIARPGNVVDYVLAHVKDGRVSLRVLWKAVIEGLEGIWPNNLAGIRRGDMWVYNPLKKIGVAGSDLVPFHKLSQWLTMSLLEPIEALGVKFDDLNLFTGLAEYRNGGLFVDMGVLTLKDADNAGITFDVGAEVVVEWRALTVALLDLLHEEVCKRLHVTKDQLPLTKVLQGGTWAAGRIVAAEKRPADASPPIAIRSNGSVF